MIPLKLEQISKYFGKHKAVNQIDLDVEEGEIFGLLGGNGVGKQPQCECPLA